MEQRLLIVDFNHMVYNFYVSFGTLTVKRLVNGQVVEKDTTIQNGTLKNINNWSKGGQYLTAVCFDRPVPARKAYFMEHFPVGETEKTEYKGGRTSMASGMFDSIQDCEQMLREAGVTCFSKPGYEADDLIFAAVNWGKEKYPNMPIDIVTNDADLLPLVDDQVSVFIRSKKGTYAKEKHLEKMKYIQVTPDNYQSIVESMSAYQKYYLPYNTLLLQKLLRGDKSDNLVWSPDITKMFAPKKFNDLVLSMTADGVDLSVFRYGRCRSEIRDESGAVFTGDVHSISEQEKSKLSVHMLPPNELGIILNTLSKYVSEEVLTHVEKAYTGMNLNQAFTHSNPVFQRKSIKIQTDIAGYVEGQLRAVARGLDINIKQISYT